MTKVTALSSLPDDWQNWIADNLARGCEPRGMAEMMTGEGHFDLALAQAAIVEADARRTGAVPAALEMPDIDTSCNRVSASDRKIDILLTLVAPRVVLLGNVLSDEECDVLTAYCMPRLERSPVVGDSGDLMQVHHARTSKGVMLERAETVLIGQIEARLAVLANWPIERGEGLQIQNYQASNEYQPHFDWFDPELPGPRKHMEHGGQRLATFVLYLSDVESGGGTTFPAIGLEILPRKGSALFFHNTDLRHVPDRRTLHAGVPVVRGVKTIANKWLRQRTY